MLKGWIDLIDHHELRGWAQDEAAPGRPVSVVIFHNEKEVGSDVPDELRNVTAKGVTLVGHVDDLSTIFDRVRLTVAPLSYGAGIKGKILDSLAAGIPCVHTTLAAEGMNLPQELEPCRADNAHRIASAVSDLHADPELYEKCRKAGLKYVMEELSEEKIDLAMRRAIRGST